MEILFKNDNYLVCIKPTGVDSESDMLRIIYEAIGKEAFCVHRLDKNVSGLMLFALNKKTAAAYSSMIVEKKLVKTYHALVEGNIEPKKGAMRDLLFHDVRRNKTYVTERQRKNVKEAELEYSVLDFFPSPDGNLSLVKISLHTGRSHQIRVQFASRKHPLVGDRTYGSKIKRKTPALISSGLEFTDPITGEEKAFLLDVGLDSFIG